MLGDLRQEQGELLSTQARGRVHGPAEAAHLAGEALEHLVAGRVAQVVIHALEVVEVRHHQAYRPLRPLPAIELDREELLETAAVAQLREGIGLRGVGEPRDQSFGVRLEEAHEHAHQQHRAHRDRPLLLGPGRPLVGQHECERHRDRDDLEEGGPAREEEDGLERDPHVEERVDAGPLLGEVNRERHQERPDEQNARDLGVRDPRPAREQERADRERRAVDGEEPGHVRAGRLRQRHRRDRQQGAGHICEPEEAGGGAWVPERLRRHRFIPPGVQALSKRRGPGRHVITYRPLAPRP